MPRAREADNSNLKSYNSDLSKIQSKLLQRWHKECSFLTRGRGSDRQLKGMLMNKRKAGSGAAHKGHRFLITVKVMLSTGPIRFIVKEEELVAAVIEIALKCYAREGRLPVLGSDLNDFFLYSPAAAVGSMSPWETIGSGGVRNFMLCKKPQSMKKEAKGSWSWKSWWINKSLNLKISSH